MKRVLSIDGGGVRGLIPALVLAEFERRAGKPTARLFDLIAGTSTGGILATMLTVPGTWGGSQYSARDVASFYREESPKIFASSWLRKLKTGFNLLDEKYSSAALKAALEKYLRRYCLSHCAVPILVSTYDIENRAPYFFKTTKARDNEREDDFFLHEVALATAAAPTYFEPAVISRDSQNGSAGHLALIDGGIFGTNTAMHAWAEARKMWPGEEIRLVSLGTGNLAGPYDYRKLQGSGQLGWIKPLLDMMMQGSSVTVDYQLNQVAGDNYMRLNRKLTWASDAMDDASAGNLDRLASEAALLVASESERIDQILERLQAPVVARLKTQP